MKAFSAAYAAMLASNAAVLAVCWRINRNDGIAVCGTSWDKPITVNDTIETVVGPREGPLSGVYNPYAGISGSNIKASGDMSVDNQEVDGAYRAPSDTVTLDITHADVAAGNFANAPVVVFLVNPYNPNDYQDVKGWGWLGEITEDSTGHYKTEVRGPAQALATQIVATCGDRCDVPRLGYGFCKFDIGGNTFTCSVASVVDPQNFSAVYIHPAVGGPREDPFTSPYLDTTWSFAFGFVTWLTGNNVGFNAQVKMDPRDNGGNIQLIDPAPYPMQPGDQFRIEPGCKRTIDDCILFEQVINFQGPGLYVPGIDVLMAGPNGLPGAGP